MSLSSSYPSAIARFAGVVVVAAAAFGAGCATLPLPPFGVSEEPSLDWTSPREVLRLKSLYDYADQLHNIGSAARRARYQTLSETEPEQRSVQQRLQLALLVGGVDETLVDFDAALEIYRLVYAQIADQPLLSGYVQARIDDLEQSAKLAAALGKTEREARRLRRSLQKTDAALASANAADSGDAADAPNANDDPRAGGDNGGSADGPASGVAEAASADRLADLEWQRYVWQLQRELRNARVELEQQTSIISEQEEQIEDFEAKIKALSAIETNLNQRE